MINENIYKWETKVKDKFARDGKFFVELEETNFYPDGKGGQLGDRGTIGKANVLFVLEEKNRVLHEVDALDIEESISCEIDKDRRLDISREHTAQHILSQSFIKLYNLETVSFHMGEEYSTIDIEGTNISQENIKEVENFANSIILEDRAVKKYYIDEQELNKIDLRKKTEIAPPIRVVEVENFDKSLCGGTHVDRTGQIGLVKILKTEKTKKDFTRIYFVSGLRALKAFQNKNEIIEEISKILTTGENELIYKIKKILEENKNISNNIRKIEEKLIEEIFNRIRNEKKVSLILENISRKAFESLAFKLKNLDINGYIALVSDNSFILALFNNSFSIPYKSYNVNGVTFANLEIAKKDEALKLLNDYFGG
jgi:alanyl-tRNA synthetase